MPPARQPPSRQQRCLLNEPMQRGTYKSVLTQLMCHAQNRQYSKDHEFPTDELAAAALTPEHIYTWMCTKVYSMPDPTPEDDPTYRRASSLMNYKKAISYFMPNKLMSWNAISKEGNPTKSVVVNDIIKAVNKKEVRKQGTPSNSDRPLKKSEFDQLITALVSLEHPKECYMIPTICKFQFHLNAQLDDTRHMKYDFIKSCPQFPFALLYNVGWSKNVRDEQDCPDQIMLGVHYCVLLSLAIYLEMWLGSRAALLNPFIFGDYGVDSETTKAWVRKVINDKVFIGNEFEKIGTHSTRKCSSTWMRRHGAHRDDDDKWGRWTSRRNKWIPTLTLSYLMWMLSAHQCCALAGPVNTC